MSDRDVSLNALYAQLETITGESDEGGDSWTAHAAILDRLAANRRLAEAAGWSALALERDGQRSHLRLVGVPPGTTLRTNVPDLARQQRAPDARPA